MSNLRQSDIPVYSSGAFSAAVRIELLISGRSVPVAQVGSDRIIFDQPVAFADRNGEVIVYIDESPQRWRVKLRPGPEPARILAADFEPMD
ncbi:MAG: hypothetical protein ACYCUV_02985 [Phycisphaerae bacterium]